MSDTYVPFDAGYSPDADRLAMARWRAGLAPRSPLLLRLRRIGCRHRDIARGNYGLRCTRCRKWWAWGQPHPA